MTSPNLRKLVAKAFDNMDESDKYPPLAPYKSSPETFKLLQDMDPKLIRWERRRWVPRPVVTESSASEMIVEEGEIGKEDEGKEKADKAEKGEKQTLLEHRLYQIRSLHRQPLMLASWLLCIAHALYRCLSQSSNDASVWPKQLHRIAIVLFALEMALNYASSRCCWTRKWNVGDAMRKIGL